MLSGDAGESGNHYSIYSEAYPSLHGLLTEIVSALGVGRACLVSVADDAARTLLADSREAQPLRSRTYHMSGNDAAVDVRYGSRTLGQLVIPDAAGRLDRSRLEAYAHAAGYIVGNADKLAELDALRKEGHDLRSAAKRLELQAAENARVAAEELRAQRSLLQTTLDNFPGVLLVMEPPPDFRLVLVNGRYLEMLPEQFRSGKESPVGKTARELSADWNEQTQALMKLMAEVHESGEPVSFEQYEASSPETGTTYWNWMVLPISAPGDDDERRFLMLIAYDVTEAVGIRKQAEEAAAEARARADELETVINQMADGVAIFDAEGNMLKMNPAGERIMGRGMAEGVEPAHYSEYYGIHDTSGEPTPSEELPSERARHGETVVRAEFVIKRPDGAEVIISVSGAPLYDGRGRLNGSVVVYHDITQEKMVERLKDEFLSIVSHELRTPLTAIIGYGDLLLRGVHGPLGERQGKAMSAVRSNATRLLHLINDLLDVSKLEAGTVRLEAKPVDLPSVVSRTIAQLRVLALDAGVKIENKLSRQSWPLVLADEPKLQQVIENLLTNAIKFTPAGGTIAFNGVLSPLPAEDPRIVESAGERSGEDAKPRSFIVSVKDSGAGIEPEQLERIWDRFYQVDSTAKRRSGGAGLGLAIVRSLVILHGGKVWAESAGANRGSRFSFSLPLAANQSEEGVSSAEPTRPAHRLPAGAPAWLAEGKSGGMVLVVEDDEYQREIVSQMLRMEGYDAMFAFDGEEAMELATSILPTAIILDVLLPRSDGWEVLHRLKADPRTANIPVLILSVVDQANFGKRLGADEYLLKPLEPQKLRSTIRRLTGKGE